MKRYIIKDKKTGQYLKRVSGFKGFEYSWVANADNAVLITTKSAASRIAGKYCASSYGETPKYRWWSTLNLVEVIEVEILMYKSNTQPFMQGFFK